MTRNRMAILLIALILPLAVSTAHDHWDVEESRELRETIPLGIGRSLAIENVHGSITIKATGGSDVVLVATEIIEARDRDRLQQAKDEVELRIDESGDGVLICVDGPFRNPSDCTKWDDSGRRNDPKYQVTYEMELEVPRDVNLRVRTIDGELSISGTRGDFFVAGVNGGIEMFDIDGSGKAHTVNGGVHIDFSGNPRDDSEFKTINGEIDVTFRGGLSADMSFQTMNGETFSDFEYEFLAPRPLKKSSKRGRTVFKLDGGTSVRIADGGPHFHFENINGDILVRKSR